MVPGDGQRRRFDPPGILGPGRRSDRVRLLALRRPRPGDRRGADRDGARPGLDADRHRGHLRLRRRGRASARPRRCSGAVLADRPALRDRMVLATKGGIRPGRALRLERRPPAWRVRGLAAPARCRRDRPLPAAPARRAHAPGRGGRGPRPSWSTAGWSATSGCPTSRRRSSRWCRPSWTRRWSRPSPSSASGTATRCATAPSTSASHGSVTPLAWSPLGGGRVGRPATPSAWCCDRLADDRGVDPTAVALAFVMAHPAGAGADPGHPAARAHRGGRRRARVSDSTAPSGTSCTRPARASRCREHPDRPAVGGRLVRRAVRRRRRAARCAGAAPAELVRALPRHRAGRQGPGVRQRPAALGLPARHRHPGVRRRRRARGPRPDAAADRGALRRDVAAAAGPPARDARPDARRRADDQHHLLRPARRAARRPSPATAAPPRS